MTGVKIWHILPPCKEGGSMGQMSMEWIFYKQSRGPTVGAVTMAD